MSAVGDEVYRHNYPGMWGHDFGTGWLCAEYSGLDIYCDLGKCVAPRDHGDSDDRWQQ